MASKQTQISDETINISIDILIKEFRKVLTGLEQFRKLQEQVAKTNDKVTESSERVAKSQNKVKRAQDGVGRTSLTTTKAFAKQSQGLGGLVRAYATVAANAFALTAAFTVLDRAAQFQNLEKAATLLSQQTGVAIRQVTEDIRELAGSALTAEQAFRTASSAITAGISTEQLEKVIVVARGASNALGRNLTDSIDRLTRGITKLEPELLDEIGIFVRIDEAVQSYANQLGIAASDVTFYGRRQAFANAALEQGIVKFGELAEAADPTPYAKIGARIRDLSVNVLGFVNNLAKPVLNTLQRLPFGVEAAAIAAAGAIAKIAIPAIGDFEESARQVALAQAQVAEATTEQAVTTQSRIANELAANNKKVIATVRAETNALKGSARLKTLVNVKDEQFILNKQKLTDALNKNISTTVKSIDAELRRADTNTKIVNGLRRRLSGLQQVRDSLQNVIVSERDANRIAVQSTEFIKARNRAILADAKALNSATIANFNATVSTRGWSVALGELTARATATGAAVLATSKNVTLYSRAAAAAAASTFLLRSAVTVLITAISRLLGPFFLIATALTLIGGSLVEAAQKLGLFSDGLKEVGQAADSAAESSDNFTKGLERIEKADLTNLEIIGQRFQFLGNSADTSIESVENIAETLAGATLNRAAIEQNDKWFASFTNKNFDRGIQQLAQSLRDLRTTAEELGETEQFDKTLEKLGISEIEDIFSLSRVEVQRFAEAINDEDIIRGFQRISAAGINTAEAIKSAREASTAFTEEFSKLARRSINATPFDRVVTQADLVLKSLQQLDNSFEGYQARIRIIQGFGLETIFDPAKVEPIVEKVKELNEQLKNISNLSDVQNLFSGILQGALLVEEEEANVAEESFTKFVEQLRNYQSQAATAKDRTQQLENQLKNLNNTISGEGAISVIQERLAAQESALDAERAIIEIGLQRNQVEKETADLAIQALEIQRQGLREQARVEENLAQVKSSFAEASIRGLTREEEIRRESIQSIVRIQALNENSRLNKEQEIELILRQRDIQLRLLDIELQRQRLQSQGKIAGVASERQAQQLKAEQRLLKVRQDLTKETTFLTAAQEAALDASQTRLENEEKVLDLAADIAAQSQAVADAQLAVQAAAGTDTLDVAEDNLKAEQDKLEVLQEALEALAEYLDLSEDLLEVTKEISESITFSDEIDTASTALQRAANLVGDDLGEALASAASIVGSIPEQLDRVGEDSARQAQVIAGAYSQVFAGLSAGFDEGSQAAAAAKAASLALAVVEAGVAVIKAWQTGTTIQEKIAAVALVASSVASILSSIGAGGGVGTSAPSLADTVEARQQAQQAATPEGGIADSLDEGLQTLIDVNFDMFTQGEQVIRELQQLQAVFTGISAQIVKSFARTLGGSGVFRLPDITRLIEEQARFGNLIDINGNRVQGSVSNLLDAGIVFDPATWGQIAGGQLRASVFADFTTTESRRRGGLAGLFGQRREVTRDFQVEFETGRFIDDAILTSFAEGIVEVANTAIDIATRLGFDPDILAERLEDFVLQSYNLSLADLSPEEQREAIVTFFSVVADDIVSTILPAIDLFRRAGEETFETLTRLFAVSEVFNIGLQRIGLTFSDVFKATEEQIQSIIDQFTTTARIVDLGDLGDDPELNLQAVQQAILRLDPETLENLAERIGVSVEEITTQAIAYDEALRLVELAFQQGVLDSLGLETAAELDEVFQEFAEALFSGAELLGNSLAAAQSQLDTGFSNFLGLIAGTPLEELFANVTDAASFREAFQQAQFDDPEAFAEALRVGTLFGLIEEIGEEIRGLLEDLKTDFEVAILDAARSFVSLRTSLQDVGVSISSFSDLEELERFLRDIPEDAEPALLNAAQAGAEFLDAVAAIVPGFETLRTSLQNLQESLFGAIEARADFLDDIRFEDTFEGVFARLTDALQETGLSTVNEVIDAASAAIASGGANQSVEDIQNLTEVIDLLGEASRSAFDLLGSAIKDLQGVIDEIQSSIDRIADDILQSGGTVRLSVGGITRSFTGLQGALDIANIKVQQAEEAYANAFNDVLSQAAAASALNTALVNQLEAELALAENSQRNVGGGVFVGNAGERALAEKEAVEDLTEAVEGLADLAKNLRDFVRDIRLDENLTIFTQQQRQAFAGQQFEETLATATGVATLGQDLSNAISTLSSLDPQGLPNTPEAQEARDNIIRIAREYLEVSREFQGTGREYNRTFNSVSRRLEALGLSLKDVEEETAPKPHPSTSSFRQVTRTYYGAANSLRQGTIDRLAQLQQEQAELQFVLKQIEDRARLGILLDEDGNLNLEGLVGLNEDILAALGGEEGIAALFGELNFNSSDVVSAIIDAANGTEISGFSFAAQSDLKKAFEAALNDAELSLDITGVEIDNDDDDGNEGGGSSAPPIYYFDDDNRVSEAVDPITGLPPVVVNPDLGLANIPDPEFTDTNIDVSGGGRKDVSEDTTDRDVVIIQKFLDESGLVNILSSLEEATVGVSEKLTRL